MKTLLVTGSTDGIGLLTAQRLHRRGHRVLLHGRNPEKLARARAALGGDTVGFAADLSDLAAVRRLAAEVSAAAPRLDVLINNAGVFKTSAPRTADSMDLRFVVNTLAPILLTRLLLPTMGAESRIVNLSSAAQAPVDLAALRGTRPLDDFPAYAQSKLALTAWSRHLAASLGATGPAVVAVNPGSYLASKMVREGFGMAGRDLGIGADVLVRLALDEPLRLVSGRYFDNDRGHFGPAHPAAGDPVRTAAMMRAIDDLLG